MDGALNLRVRWVSPPPGDWQGHPTEFGMQSGRDLLLPGTPQDGHLVFETMVEPYTDKQGRQRFRGDCVHGPPDQPFLYLSYRVRGGTTWVMRAKILLMPFDAEFLAGLPSGATLETDASRLGHRAGRSLQDWRAV